MIRTKYFKNQSYCNNLRYKAKKKNKIKESRENEVSLNMKSCHNLLKN